MRSTQRSQSYVISDPGERERRSGAMRAGCTLIVLLLLIAAVCVGVYCATTRNFPPPSQHTSLRPVVAIACLTHRL